ncbi:cytochrome P450 [Kineosporia rhizophila]|uniref:cytochrome P450 n=1 Tax=Kineosporia TaxID=49184 RepID=UPI001E2BC5F0|nr:MULTISPECIES: cytochrome P450 [Kineosporia]MCE0535927.1 cytochrome P450 [Kineosporia rhizophila]GLY14245.1 cytochrome P450 [Kineosporia sp. NBRC 101677]
MSTPVQWDEQLGAFRVRGFEEASAVLRGQGWSSDPARSPLVPPEMTRMPTSMMIFTDPPDHTRLRRLVAPAFSARAVEAFRGRVAAVVESCLDQIEDDFQPDEPDGAVDLLADFGYLVPLAVIAELLDVGVEGAQVFLEQTPDLVRLLEVDAGPEDVELAVTAGLEVTLFLTPVLAARKSGEGEDFVSQLLRTELTVDEVMATCMLLLAAGHETTANLIATGSLALMRHRDQLPALHRNPSRAIEELVRLEGPVRVIGRTATTDHELGGVRVGAGQAVLVELDRAARDERRWPDPDRLDLSREGPGHLGFGTGIHFCLGAALARLEAEEALTRLFDRHPNVRPVQDVPRWRTSSTFHALAELPVRL